VIDFVKTAPLIKDKKGNLLPEIRLSPGTILAIEYPINIYSPSFGLCHQGVGGHFTYKFKKDGASYRITFTKDYILFDKMDKKYSVEQRKEYKYPDLLRFIKRCNSEKSLLYGIQFEPVEE